MKADEKTDLETNALAQSLSGLAGKAKAGKLVNFRLLGLVLAAAVALSLWVILSRQTKKADSQTWRDLDAISGPESLETFAAAHGGSVQGRVAKLQRARTLLGPSGISLMSSFGERKKAIENIEKARDILGPLIGEFKDDPTLKAQAIEAAAKAELALVGVAKEGGTEDRGSVDKAADLYKQFAATVGPKTPLGEAYEKRAKDLLDQKSVVVQVGKDLNNQFSPPPIPDIKAPPAIAVPTVTPAGPIAPPSITPPVVPPAPAVTIPTPPAATKK